MTADATADGDTAWTDLAADRQRLDRLEREVLVLGRWSKADVHLLDHRGGKAVFKDYRRKWFLVRWIGAWQLAREARAYGRLAGLAGIPRCYGRPDRWSILLEYIEGDRLSRCRGDEYDMAALLDEFKQVIRQMHEAGFTHNDLRCRENILVRERDHHIFLIDFSGMLTFPIGSLRRRLLFPLARRVDRGAWLKWKFHLAPEAFTPEEREEHRRSERLRRLWVINRHRPKQ